MPAMTSPEFAITFGAMLLALVFAFLLLPFGLWIFVRPLIRRVRKASVEQLDGTVRANVELEAEATQPGLWWRAQRFVFGVPVGKEPAE